jgi:hypothetical protein
MDDITNQSFHQRCSSIVERIKKEKENRDELMSLSTIQNNLLSPKRHSLNEIEFIQTARLQSYTNWPHFTPSRDVMSSNGWFYCGVSDRVLCIYCNTICHQWTNTDDPEEVHKRLSPQCPFVLSTSPSSLKDSPSIISQSLLGTFKPHHKTMCEISRRLETFDNPTWTQTSPSAIDLAQAGFFYSGSGNSVTCFYCNGSLHKWGDKDDPKIEHGRWFSNCIYARHLCGDRLHNKIQMAKAQFAKKKNEIDEDTLSRLVNARIDLPFVQRLRTQYPLSVIRRCIEDQWKTNGDDFASDDDLAMACFIFKKQVDIIRVNQDKMIIPSQSQMSVSSSGASSIKLEECLVCLTEERQIACMPCGHLCTCVPCGYSLRSCPICRQEIQSFVRINF